MGGVWCHVTSATHWRLLLYFHGRWTTAAGGDLEAVSDMLQAR